MYLRTFLINNVTKLLFWLLDFQYAKLWLKIRGFLHEHNENINHMDCFLSTAYPFYVTFKLSKRTHLSFWWTPAFFCGSILSGFVFQWGQAWYLCRNKCTFSFFSNSTNYQVCEIYITKRIIKIYSRWASFGNSKQVMPLFELIRKSCKFQYWPQQT